MRIVQITISSEFTMSDKWMSICENDESIDFLKTLTNWSYHFGGLQSPLLCHENKIMEISEVLSSFGIQFETQELRENFHLYLTNAPEDYDYDTAFTVDYDCASNKRIVAILASQADYQIGRYRSGLYQAELLTIEPTV